MKSKNIYWIDKKIKKKILTLNIIRSTFNLFIWSFYSPKRIHVLIIFTKLTKWQIACVVFTNYDNLPKAEVWTLKSTRWTLWIKNCMNNKSCMHLQVALSIKLGTVSFRTGSSTLTGEEKSEQPRPSELMGTQLDPLLSECSLRRTNKHNNHNYSLINIDFLNILKYLKRVNTSTVVFI